MPEAYRGRDARALTDRELLVLTYENVRETRDTLRDVSERVVILETKVDNGIPAPRVKSVGIPAAVTTIAIAMWEVLTRLGTKVSVG